MNNPDIIQIQCWPIHSGESEQILKYTTAHHRREIRIGFEKFGSYRNEIASVLAISSEIVVPSIALDACWNLFQLVNWLRSRLLNRFLRCRFGRSFATPEKVPQRALPSSTADSTTHYFLSG